MTRTDPAIGPSIPMSTSESPTPPATGNTPQASESSQASAQLQNLASISRTSSSSGSFKSARSRLSEPRNDVHQQAKSSSQAPRHEPPVTLQQMHEVDRMDETAETIIDDIDEGMIAAEGHAASASKDGPTLAEPTSVSAASSTAKAAAQAAMTAQALRAAAEAGAQTRLRADALSTRATARAAAQAAQAIVPMAMQPAQSAPALVQGIMGNREVNNINHLRNTLPNDIHGCVSALLSPIKSEFSADGFDSLVRARTTTLERKGIRSKEQLITVLQTVTRKDNLMRLAQGAVGGAHFNGPGIATSYGPEPTELVLQNSSAGTNAIQGMVGGVIAGLSDAVSTPAKAKTFTDAYYKRPAADHLPQELRGVNTQTGAQAIGETNISWVGAFGASYALRGTARLIATQTAGPAAGAAIDTALATPVNVASGIGATFIQHKIDERKGRSGMPFFIARTNLSECIDAARKPMHAYAGSALLGAGKHAVNVITQSPAGVKAAATDPALLASTTMLGAGLTLPFTAASEVQERLANHPKTADFLGSITKYAALEGVWAAWSTAYAGASHLHANRQVPTGSAPTTGDVEEHA
jgi:hypothetical protein